jgi:regulator of sigma E protease
MDLLQTVIAFIVVLGTLVVVHELGHYLVARWCGVKVLRFSVGMGKVVYSRRLGRDQTEWAISILPLGGYVKMLDARDINPASLSPEDLKREFTGQSVWRRIAIVVAGPIANFLLAIAVFAALYMHGLPEPVAKLRTVPAQTMAFEAGLRGNELVTAVNGEPVQLWSEVRWKLMQAAVAGTPATLEVVRNTPKRPDAGEVSSHTLAVDRLDAKDLESDFLSKLGLELARPRALLGTVMPDGAAMQAGLRTGDLILEADGVSVADALALVELIRNSPGRPVELRVLRAGTTTTLTVVPDALQQNGQAIGRIGVELPLAPDTIVVRDNPLEALSKGAVRTWDMSVLTLKMVGKMITGEMSWKNVTGPITIADYAGQTARIGVVSFLTFIAFVSISLGVMNLLPIPMLDGGLLLYYSLEVLTGRPVSERFGAIAQRAGLGILMTLMLVAVFNDIVRLMS